MSPRKCMLSFVVVGIAALAVAGCGASGSGSASKPASPAATTSNVAVKTPLATSVTLLVKSDTEKAKLGPDRQWHDAFLPGDFSIKAGQTVTVTVWNYDDAAHSFTAPSLGINKVLPGGSEKAPHKTTFTFTAPSKAGSYAWFCAMPCDPWAMAHDGFMRGFVKVTA